MSKWIIGVCVSVAVLGVALRGQDGTTTRMSRMSQMSQMSKMDKMDKMESAANEHTYTGCVERAAAGHYTLTHVTPADAMTHEPMKHEPMTQDAMGPMKDSMAPEALGLSSPSINLNRHVGHKVSVSGTQGDAMSGVTTFTVKSLKMVAKSCS